MHECKHMLGSSLRARAHGHTARGKEKTKPSNNNPLTLTLVPSSWRREGLWERRQSLRTLNTLSVASSGDWQCLNERFPVSQLNYKLPGSTWLRGKDIPIHPGQSHSCRELLPGVEDGKRRLGWISGKIHTASFHSGGINSPLIA